MKTFFVITFNLIVLSFSNQKIYYYEKCQSTYTKLDEALYSIGVYPSPNYKKHIANLNGIPDYTFTQNIFGDIETSPELDNQLLSLLKEGKLISYIDYYLPFSEIEKNFKKAKGLSEIKDELKIMCLYFLEKSEIKTPFIAALLANINELKGFGKLKDFSEESEFYNKIVTEISLKKLKEFSFKKSSSKIGCLSWKDQKADDLVELYLDETNGNEKIEIEYVVIAEARMIIKELIFNKKSLYYDWSNRTECRNMLYFNSSADVFANIYASNYGLEDNEISKKIYKIMTESENDSQELYILSEMKKRVEKLTKDLFGFELIFSNDYEETILFPNGKLIITLFNRLKIEKKGYFKYIIENKNLKESIIELDLVDTIINQIKDILKLKIKVGIFSLTDFIKAKCQYLPNSEIYINFDYIENSIEWDFIFTDKLNDYSVYDSGVKYKFTYDSSSFPQEIISTTDLVDAVKLTEYSEINILQEAISYGVEGFLVFLKNVKIEVYSFIMILIAIIKFFIYGLRDSGFIPA